LKIFVSLHLCLLGRGGRLHTVVSSSICQRPLSPWIGGRLTLSRFPAAPSLG
jgi:hypothetical protein